MEKLSQLKKEIAAGESLLKKLASKDPLLVTEAEMALILEAMEAEAKESDN